MTILYIEDEELARIGLVKLLQQQGHSVDVACNTDDAVEHMGRTRYDLLLLDIMLEEPGEELEGTPVKEAGKELLIRLRSGRLGELRTPPDVQVVAITAVSDLPVNAALADAGVQLILQKPIGPADALEAMREILGGVPQ